MNARLSRLMKHDRRWTNRGAGPGLIEWSVLAVCAVAIVALTVAGV